MELTRQREEVLGSFADLQVPAGHAHALPACFEELRRIEARFSRFQEDSELSRLNRSLGKWQDVSGEMTALLEHAAVLYQETEGCFDIGVKSGLDRLGYDKSYSFKPQPKTTPSPAKPVAAPHPPFLVDRLSGQARLEKQIDFGGLGKGYALDRIASLLEAHGCPHYLINAGGDLLGKQEPGQEPWKILLENPDDPARALGTLELDGKSLAGSAPNRRTWGNGLHHLINAKTGTPAQGTKAVFVLADTGLQADAYATAIFTAGFEGGIALSKRLPCELLSISSENKMFQSPGFPFHPFD